MKGNYKNCNIRSRARGIIREGSIRPKQIHIEIILAEIILTRILLYDFTARVRTKDSFNMYRLTELSVYVCSGQFAFQRVLQNLGVVLER